MAMENESGTIPLGLYLWKRSVSPSSEICVVRNLSDTRWRILTKSCSETVSSPPSSLLPIKHQYIIILRRILLLLATSLPSPPLLPSTAIPHLTPYRIYEIGVETVMGVPGDFQLDILDYIYDIDGMSFIGNSNELNAAYAADGYARVKRKPGCVITTHGVGELSALNGIAGAASERIPLIHVVGQTPRLLQEKRLMIHHSIGSTGEVDAQVYQKTSKLIRADAAELWDGDEAPAEIDRVLKECVRRKAPVYIFMPLDLHAHRVPSRLLDTKIDLSVPVDEAALDAVVSAISKAVLEAKKPVVFLDMLAHHAEDETRAFVDAVKLPFLAAHGAKAIVDEDHDWFVGLYNGSVSSPGVADFIEASDCVMAVGWWPADTNGGLGRKVEEGKRVDVMDEFVVVSVWSY